jgi:hypothetical protein
MKTVKFNELTLTDKALLMAEYGQYLESIEFYDYWIHLYSLNAHFIEIWYNVVTKHVEKIELLQYKDMDRYVSRIVIHNFNKP